MAKLKCPNNRKCGTCDLCEKINYEYSGRRPDYYCTAEYPVREKTSPNKGCFMGQYRNKREETMLRLMAQVKAFNMMYGTHLTINEE
jgi:hypothetical protein